jgi:ubiquinone/menaquinone biosynthesis C-methylase UbiE
MAAKSFLDTAEWYDPLFEGVLAGLREMAARMAPPKKGMKVLDIGCGTGAQLAIYEKAGGDVLGIDLAHPMLRVAKSKLGEKAVLTNGDATEMPFPDQTFDLVLSSLFFHQLGSEVRSAALGEAIRVLQPEGRILLIDFHPGTKDSLRGKVTEFLISTVEFFAGWEHFSNSRDFLDRGGIPSLAATHQLNVRKTFVVGDGNIGLYLLRLA